MKVFRYGSLPVCCLIVGLAGAPRGHGTEAERPSDAGLAIIETPEAGRAFVSGPVSAFARSSEGVLFVGSHRLASFDGAVWRAIAVPGSTRVLALAQSPAEAGGAPAPERIWVGASGTIGCLEKDSRGEWIFHSFKDQLAAANLGDIDEVRYVHPTGRGAIFVARSRVLRWDGEKMTAWDLPSAIRLYAFTDGETLLVYQSGVGLLRLEDGGPRLWLPEGSLPAAPPMVGYLTVNGGQHLAVFVDAVYRHTEEGGWIRLEGISDLLRGKRAMRAVARKNNVIAIGTAYAGVVLTEADGTVRRVVSSPSGLPDDNVSTVWMDGADQLWIGMARGLARLSDSGAASLFDPRVRLSTRDIRKVLWYEGRPVVITGQSVYALVPATAFEAAHFSRIETYWLSLRDGAVVDGQMWLGDSGGLWRVAGEKGVHEPQVSSEVFLLFAPRALPHGFLFFENDACMAWLPDAQGGTAVSLHQNLGSPPVSAVEDSHGTIYVSTINGQIHAFVWNNGERQLQRVAHYGQGQGLPAFGTRPVLSSLDGTVVAFTDQGVLAFDEGQAEFKPAEAFADFVVVAGASSAQGGAYWVVQHKELGAVGPRALLRVERDPSDHRWHWRPLFAPGLDQAGDVSSLNLTSEGGAEVLWIGGTNALLRYETARLRPAGPAPALALQRVQLGARDLAPLTAGGRARFPASVNRLEFSFAAGAATAADSVCFYQTRLAGIELEWSAPHNTPHREFTGLPAGQYAFMARAIDRYGRAGPIVSYDFAVESAWYRQLWALAAGAVIAALLVGGLVRWRVRQLKHQTERLNRLVNERTRELS
ncbi:MAG: hypothetical protein ACHQ5A_09150, partial [Opitutales bacterium]